MEERDGTVNVDSLGGGNKGGGETETACFSNIIRSTNTAAKCRTNQSTHCTFEAERSINSCRAGVAVSAILNMFSHDQVQETCPKGG